MAHNHFDLISNQARQNFRHNMLVIIIISMEFVNPWIENKIIIPNHYNLIFCFPNYIPDFQFVIFSSTSSTQVMKTNELVVVGQPILNRLAAPEFLSLWVLQSITRFGQPSTWHCQGAREFSRCFANIDPIAQCCPKVCPLSPSTARRQLRHTFFWVSLS